MDDKDDTIMTLSVPDGAGGVIETGPFTGDMLREAVDSLRGGSPMKETDADRAVKDRTYGVAADELRAFIERIERLEEDKAEIADQVKEVFAEAKGRGYDTKAMRIVLKLRARDPDDIAEEDAIVEMYKAAMGMPT